MIEWDKSAELNNCSVKELKARFERFPQSNKKIITNCNNCDKKRILSFCDYHGDDHDLCQSCSVSTPEAREAASMRQIELYEDQKRRDDFSARMIKYWSMQNNRDDQSDLKKQFYIDHPEAIDAISERTIEQFSTQEARDEHSRIMIEYFKNHPEVCIFISEKMKESDTVKVNIEAMRCGHDIIKHHWLYDDADLSKYTMPMTRSDHGKMHRRMQLDGYEVKCINSVEDDNRLWGYR